MRGIGVPAHVYYFDVSRSTADFLAISSTDVGISVFVFVLYAYNHLYLHLAVGVGIHVQVLFLFLQDTFHSSIKLLQS